MEGAIKSYDPLAYWVDVVSEINPEVVRVHREKDTARQKELLARGKGNYDIFICVNKSSHAFLVCAPHNDPPEGHPLEGSIVNDPFKIPEQLLCWTFELCFQNQELRMYRIRKQFSLFKDISPRIQQSYFMGKYDDVSPNALQFAVLRSAPHHYNAIINDCVEFSKEFCLCLLSYCSNWKRLEEEVNRRITEVSATGLSIERLSRRVQSSALMGNSFLTGIDASSLFGGRNGLVLIVMLFIFLLVYPVVVAVIIVKLL